jgi:aspartyl-tRNA(Asn)/glutamyl-tRNA(Gln) amidotransferase subunit A
MSEEICALTIAETAALIEQGEISPVAVVEACLDRIDAIGPDLDAFITLTADAALAQARDAESQIAAGKYLGALHGIPFGLKDIYETAGILTSAHSKILIDNIPKQDATTTARLYAAGGILLGKLATHEFAHGGPSFDLPWPPARNPWNPDHVTGGSSSGSGAAVAAGLVKGALGSDTGGSIRNPACLCGIVGLKPTYGLVSRAGVIANSYTFDHCGPMTWTVEDCAIMLQALAGHDPADPASASISIPDYRAALCEDIRGLRIGVIRHFWEEDLPASEEVRASMEAALDVFRGLGASVEDARMRPMQDYYDVKVTIAESELFAIHASELQSRPEDFGADFRGRVLPACLMSGADYVNAQRERRVMLSEIASLYEKYDVLVTAGVYGPAGRLGVHSTVSFWQKPSIATPFNVTGGPALAQCNGFSKSGLPLSMQVIGRPFDEPTVLRTAHAYEKATTWRENRPKVRNANPIVPSSTDPISAQIDTTERNRVAAAVENAGLRLSESDFEQVCAAAPHVAAMVGRLKRKRGYGEEPGNTFTAL